MAQNPFESATVPLRQQASSPEVRLPDEVVDYYEIEGGTPIDIEPHVDGTMIVLDLTVGDVDESLATTMRVRQSGEESTWYARLPKPMVIALGLDQLADGEAKAMIEYVDDETMRMRTAPAIIPWQPESIDHAPTAVQQLDVVEKPMFAIRNPEQRSVPMQFRYDFGVDYRDAFDLDAGEEIALRYGAIDGELALMIEVDPAEGSGGYRRSLQSQSSGDGETMIEQLGVYPHKSHVQSLGLGTEPLVDDENPGIRVLTVPQGNAVALLPVTDEDGEQVDVVDELKQETDAPA